MTFNFKSQISHFLLFYEFIHSPTTAHHHETHTYKTSHSNKTNNPSNYPQAIQVFSLQIYDSSLEYSLKFVHKSHQN